MHQEKQSQEGNPNLPDGGKGDPVLIELDKMAEQKLRNIVQSLKQATGKSLPSESEMPAKSKEELLAIIAPVMDKGPDAVIEALSSSGCVALKQPGGEGGENKDMPKEEPKEMSEGDMGGNPFGGATAKMPMDDMRKGAVAAAMK